MELDPEACYRALAARDARFDGRFFTAVLTTGIFCRPTCPARTPKFEHCLFLRSAAAAQAAGFRSCLRCNPETAPETSAWRGTATTVTRALRFIHEGYFDEEDQERFATRLGVSGRHLRRLFNHHLGTSPNAVAQARRILFAKKLLGETRLPIGDVAIAAGFSSVRRFNTVMQDTYKRPPRDLRREFGKTSSTGESSSAITLKLPFRPPYNWHTLLAFFKTRAVPGLESVEDHRYSRTIESNGAVGSVTVELGNPEKHLLVTISISDVAELAPIVGRLRRMFDVDADVEAISDHLSSDPHLRAIVAAHPGLRMPGAWDPFELAVRGILGQQISVAAARTLAGRLVAAFGIPLPEADPSGALRFLFPRPEALSSADLTGIGVTRSRAATLSTFAQTLVKEPDLFETAGQTFESVAARLQLVPGIGPWTAHYIGMRALHEPDAFPAADLGLIRAMKPVLDKATPLRLTERAEAWRPWRAYAAMHLWQSLSPNDKRQ